ncbi:Ig-like domain-containing protein [Ideonella paludis]
MIRSLWGVVLGLMVALLTACGGGGSDAGDCVIGCSGDGGSTAKVSELRIALSSNTIDLTSPSPVTVTVTAVNAANQAVADALVTVSVDQEGNILAGASKTDASGVLTATLNAGTNKSVRVMTITAVSGTVSKQASVAVVEGGPSSPVSDLRVALSSASIDASAPAPVAVTVTAVNASNQVVSNAPVTLSVANGGLITAAAAKTDGSGILTGNLELGDNRAVRTMTVTAISGAIAKSAVVSVVEGSPSAAVAELRVTAATSTISNKAPAPVEVTVQAVNANNLPVSGAPVTVRADQGGCDGGGGHHKCGRYFDSDSGHGFKHHTSGDHFDGHQRHKDRYRHRHRCGWLQRWHCFCSGGAQQHYGLECRTVHHQRHSVGCQGCGGSECGGDVQQRKGLGPIQCQQRFDRRIWQSPSSAEPSDFHHRGR